jgi:Starch-binding associating with outer membrane
MKKIGYICGLMAATLLLPVSCSDFVEGFELSPNSPTQSSPPLLTTVIEVATFSHYSSSFARNAGILTQQCAGIQAQSEDVAKYEIGEGDNDDEWESLYSAMLDCDLLISLAGDGNPYYQGIGKVLKAMNAALTTDIWGDMPYTEALKGQENLRPKFDPQESVYQDINRLLTDAISDFRKMPDNNAILPAEDDVMFNGDMEKWLITAHVLQARYANRLSKKDAQGSATKALAAVDAAVAAGMTGSGSDANAIFPGAGNSLNQWYAFQQDRQNYIKMGAGFVNFLKSINDPRLSFYAAPDAAGGISGTPLGSTSASSSNIGDYFASANSNAPLVTYVEAKFIEAEAAFRANDKARAADAHNAAIKAHVKKVTGADAPAAYVSAQASETAATITLEKIMTHKYVAMFTQFEVWSDWRRTNIPQLTPDSRGAIGGIPRRYPTPQNERIYNANAQVVSDLLRPVWWDAQ